MAEQKQNTQLEEFESQQALKGAESDDPADVLKDVYDKTTDSIGKFFDARRKNLDALFGNKRGKDIDAQKKELQDGLDGLALDAKLRVSLFTSYTAREYRALLERQAEARLHMANHRADLDTLSTMQSASEDAIRSLHGNDRLFKNARVWLDIRRDRREQGYGQQEKVIRKDTKKSEKVLGKVDKKVAVVNEAIEKRMAKYKRKAEKFETKARKYLEQRDNVDRSRTRIEHLERQLRQEPQNTSLKRRLEKARGEFQKLADTQMDKRDKYLQKTPYYSFYKIQQRTDTDANEILARADSHEYLEYLRINLGLDETEARALVESLAAMPEGHPFSQERVWKRLVHQHKDMIKFLVTGWYKGHTYTDSADKNFTASSGTMIDIMERLHYAPEVQRFARLGIKKFDEEMAKFVKTGVFKRGGLKGLFAYLQKVEYAPNASDDKLIVTIGQEKIELTVDELDRVKAMPTQEQNEYLWRKRKEKMQAPPKTT